jgi:hypothetical protein
MSKRLDAQRRALLEAEQIGRHLEKMKRVESAALPPVARPGHSSAVAVQPIPARKIESTASSKADTWKGGNLEPPLMTKAERQAEAVLGKRPPKVSVKTKRNTCTQITTIVGSKEEAERRRALEQERQKQVKQALIEELRAKPAVTIGPPHTQTPLTDAVAISGQGLYRVQSLVKFMSSEYAAAIDSDLLVRSKPFRKCVSAVISAAISGKDPTPASTMMKALERTAYYRAVAEWICDSGAMTYSLSIGGHAEFKIAPSRTPKGSDLSTYLAKHKGDINAVFGAARINAAKAINPDEKSEDILDSRLIADGCYGMGKRR